MEIFNLTSNFYFSFAGGREAKTRGTGTNYG